MKIELRGGICEAFLYVYALCVSGYTFMGKCVGAITYIVLFLIVLLKSFQGIHAKLDKEKIYLLILGVYAFGLQIYHYFHDGKNSVLLTHAALIAIIVFLLICIPHAVEFKKLCLVYEAVAVICSIGIVIQFIKIFLFHMAIERICILPSSWLFTNVGEVMRPVSIFTEPSGYGSFATIAVIFALYEKKKKLAIYLAGTIVLSTSLSGILMVAFIFWYKQEDKKLKLRLGTVTMGVFIVITLIIVLYILKTGGLDFARYYRSFQIRVLNGFRIIQKIDYSKLIFGIGIGNVGNIVNSKSGDATFLSGITAVLVNCGIIEFLLFCVVLVNLIKDNNRNSYGRLIGWLIVLASLGKPIFFNFNFLMWFSAYYFFHYYEKNMGKVKLLINENFNDCRICKF